MTVKTLSACFTKIARKTYLIGAFFIASSLVSFAASAQAQQNSTADKPSGAQPGAVDTIKTAPTYKPLDSLMQKTKTTGVHPWSNDPDYVRELANIENNRKYDLEKVKSDSTTGMINAENRRNSDNIRIAKEQGVLALRCLAGYYSEYTCAEYEAELIEDKVQVENTYKSATDAIKNSAQQYRKDINYKRDKEREELDDRFSKDPKYKEPEAPSSQGKRLEKRFSAVKA